MLYILVCRIRLFYYNKKYTSQTVKNDIEITKHETHICKIKKGCTADNVHPFFRVFHYMP